MTTPICRTCGAKFPGRVTCKTCGSDPAAPAQKVAKAALVRKATTTYTIEDRRLLRARVRSITATQKKRKHGRNV
jgi:uncharacterized OB-fold protein